MQVVITITEVILFIILMYTYYRVSTQGEVSDFSKWVITLSSVGILFFADKIKLLIWLIAVGVIWLIRYYKKEKNDRMA